MNVMEDPARLIRDGSHATARRGSATSAHLDFRVAAGRTFLARQFTPHPFHITRPFYLPDDPEGMATLYLQSSSGGLYGDDRLALAITAEERAAVHVTTQASTIVPASHGGRARLDVRLAVGEGALLEYMPDPLILFDGADAETSLEIVVGAGARAIVADAVVLHAPRGGRPENGTWRNAITVADDGLATPRLVERQQLRLGDPLPLGAVTGAEAAQSPCYGAVYCVGIDTGVAAATITAGLAALHADMASRDALYWGVSPLAGKGIVGARFLCRDGAVLSAALDAAWIGARLACCGGTPVPRRK